MREIFKKFIVLCLVFLFAVSPVMASDTIKSISLINHDFSASDVPEVVRFKPIKKLVISDKITIPQRSLVTAEVLQAQKERRWHKSGYIICRLEYYITEEDEIFDVSDENIYFIARKYEPIDVKEASLIATEIILAQGASFFAPGADILYFFTKGAIQRKKHPNWFRAGVSNAYDNSICWFWLKGKPIDLVENQTIKLKSVEEEKALKLKGQIDKRKAKQAVKDEKKAKRIAVKLEKREAKAQLKAEKQLQKEEAKQEKAEAKMQLKAEKQARKEEIKKTRQEIKQSKKEAKNRLKEEKRANKEKIKQEKEALVSEQSE